MKKIKNWIGHWNAFEVIWLVTFCIIAIYITIISKDTLFGFTVFLSGILCVVLVAKGNIMNYIVGTYNTIGYAWMAYGNGLFGEVGLNILFYLPMNVIGFIMWHKHINNGTVIMKKLNIKWILGISAISAVCIAGFGYILSLLTSQNTPYIDATTNILSIVATILMVRRFREQWAAYIITNLFSVIMWSVRTASGSPEGPLMIVMWSAYLINSFYGFYNWSKGAKQLEVCI